MTETEALVALNLLPQMGPIRVRRLMSALGSASEILRASTHALQSVQGIGPEFANTIRHWEKNIDLASELRIIEESGLTLLTEEAFPPSLRAIPDAPLLLYVWGEILPRDVHSLSIVGSRRVSPYGKMATKKLTYPLAQSGFTIVSGLARGIDTIAHETALAAGGRTIAVIGSGLSKLYPPENFALAEKIAAGNGAVISEFPLHYPPNKQTFPLRNRIVAAWSQATIVAESPISSGSLITAQLANEYGHTVYAIPGPIDSPYSEGCHHLIRNGATLLGDATQVLDDFSLLPGMSATEPPILAEQPDLSPNEQKVLALLSSREMDLDDLSSETQLAISQLLPLLTHLELQQLAEKTPGGRYIRR